MADIAPPLSYAAQGQYTSNWWSLTDIKEPDIQRKAVKIYGKGFELLEIWNLMGKTYNMPNDTHYIYEQDALERLITIGGAGITNGGVGAAITFTLDAADYNANGNAYLRNNEMILIPKEYLAVGTLMDYQYLVTGRTGTGAATIYTAIPFLKDGTTFQAAQIVTTIPAGTKLAVTYDSYTRGSHQPRGLTANWFKKVYRTGLHKDTWELEGGNESQTWIELNLDISTGRIDNVNGKPGFIRVGQEMMEFMVDKKINNALLMAQPNENAAAGFYTNEAGESSPYLTTMGLIPWIQLLGQRAPYTGDWEIANLDGIKSLMISQGEIAQDIYFFMGDMLYQNWENSGYNFIKEYGHDPVMKNMEDLGLEFRTMKKLGYNFIGRELTNFSNPVNYGAAAYNDRYRKMGIMVPTNEIPVRKGNMETPGTLSNLTIGYKVKNGENRTRVMGQINGMTGQPYPIVTDVDVIKGYVLTEPALIVTKANQFVLVEGQ